MIDLASVELMIPKKTRPFSREGWGFEFKFDGDRCLASPSQLLSRKKTDMTGDYPEIVATLKALGGSFILDGEVCVLNPNGIPDFEALRNRGRYGPPATFAVFDILVRRGRDLRRLPLMERKHLLRNLIPVDQPRIRYVDYIEDDGEAVYALAVAAGYEGTVGKDLTAPYIGGTTTRWLKCKPADIHDGWKRRPRAVVPPAKLVAALRKFQHRR